MIDFIIGRHGIGAGKARSDDRASSVGVRQQGGQVDVSEQAMAEGPAERVAGADAVKYADISWRDLDGPLGRPGQGALGPHLDHRQLYAQVE